MTENMTQLEKARGERLLRRYDTLGLIEHICEEAIRRGDISDHEVDGVRGELLTLMESASWELAHFRREHAIPE